MNADGTSPSRLTNNAALDQSSMYSQDGKRIAFASFRDGNAEIYVMNADGSNPMNITRSPAADNQPDWGLVYNDAFASSRVITGGSTSIAGSTLAATRESGEPDHYIPVNDTDWIGDHSVWYRWTAPASGRVEVDLCETNFDTILSVYTGGSIGTLKRVADNNNACPSGWGSKLAFEATAGTVYNIAVSGAGGLRAGIFTLKVGLVVDNTPPPAPVITSPTSNPLDRDGVFTVSGTAEPNSTVRLREGEDSKGGAPVGADGAWSARLTGVSDGPHTYVAEASDRAGNTSAASNPVSVTVDSTPPDTTITSGPSGWKNSTSATFAFSSSEANSTFECRLRSLAENAPAMLFSGCSSQKEYAGLADGSYAFEVRATDTLDHTDASPASRTFTVDTTAPETTLASSGPSGTLNTASASFAFSSSEAGSTFRCRLDGGAFEPCSSPKDYTDLADGRHDFSVRATDRARNVDATPASRTWTVDTVKPSITGATPTGKGVKRNINLTATFSEKMNRATMTKTTFQLFKINSNGTTTQITNVTVALSSDGLRATLNPFGTATTLLAANSRYRAVVTTGARDLAGNQLDQNLTSTGSQPKSWTFTTGGT
jgi:hypothetical protein